MNILIWMESKGKWIPPDLQITISLYPAIPSIWVANFYLVWQQMIPFIFVSPQFGHMRQLNDFAIMQIDVIIMQHSIDLQQKEEICIAI